MNKHIFSVFSIICIILLSGCTTQAPSQTQAPAATAASIDEKTEYHDNIYLVKSGRVGMYLTDFAGNTLYTYDKDADGFSNCLDACAKKWRPYTSGATAQGALPKNITLINRPDGTTQFAWKGKPLYYYAKDQTAGEMTGNGVDEVWHVARE